MISIQTICGIGLKVEPFQLGLSRNNERVEISGLPLYQRGVRERDGSKEKRGH